MSPLMGDYLTVYAYYFTTHDVYHACHAYPYFFLFLFLLSDFFSKTGSSSRLTSVTLVSIHPTLPKEEFHTLYKTAIHTMFSIPRRNRFCLFDSPCQGTHYFLSFLLFYDTTDCLRASLFFLSPYVNLTHDETRQSTTATDSIAYIPYNNYLFSYVTHCSDGGKPAKSTLQHHPIPAEKMDNLCI
jgi:hypothetical protein